jgi:hypothetical protein
VSLRVHRFNARRQLFRQLQQFFEEHLTGLWTISDVSFDAPELLPKEPGKRQLHREQVIGHFGHYTVCLSSPEEKPPLGEILCTSVHGDSVRGSLDPATWSLVALMIRPSATNGDDHVDDGRGYRAFR